MPIGSFLVLKVHYCLAPTARKMPAWRSVSGIAPPAILSALKGRREPAPLQGAKLSVDTATQGVALG